MKRDKFRRDKESHSESLRFCAFDGRDMAVTCREVFLRKCSFDKKRTGILGRATSFGRSSLRLSKSCTASRLHEADSPCRIKRKHSRKRDSSVAHDCVLAARPWKVLAEVKRFL